MECKSCAIKISKGIVFPCPKCKKEIYRCTKCRKLSIEYKCDCGFAGP